MTHILKSFSSDQSSISDSNNNNSNEIKDSLSLSHDHDNTNNLDLICNLCIPQRNFSNSDALFQHTRAKHSTSSSLSSSQLSIPPITSQIITPPPSSSTSIINSINSLNPLEECPICGVILSSMTLEQHLEEIIPPIQLDFQCDKCSKIFHSERGLSQHLKFCLLEEEQNIDS